MNDFSSESKAVRASAAQIPIGKIQNFISCSTVLQNQFGASFQDVGEFHEAFVLRVEPSATVLRPEAWDLIGPVAGPVWKCGLDGSCPSLLTGAPTVPEVWFVPWYASELVHPHFDHSALPEIYMSSSEATRLVRTVSAATAQEEKRIILPQVLEVCRRRPFVGLVFL
jgi:hypothetical protein